MQAHSETRSYLWVQISQICHMLFRHNKGMAGGSRRDVEECNPAVILVNDVMRKRSCHDPAERTIDT